MSDERAEEVPDEVRKLSDGLGRLLEEKRIGRHKEATLMYQPAGREMRADRGRNEEGHGQQRI